MNVGLLNLLNGVLGSYTRKTGDNYAFHCPFCNHPKKKLEIHLVSHKWSCWVCSAKGRKLYTLFKRVNANQEQLQQLSQYVPKTFIPTKEEKTNISLPKQFIPLWEERPKDFLWNTCVEYLQSRGVDMCDIQKYRLGYCEDGTYKDMIIFPNYNRYGQLNYFTTRSFLRNSSTKFRNPPHSKNVIGFELQVNWNLPVVIVESALDAITIGNNSIPLYGKIIPKRLKEKILTSDVSKLYVALDSDARNDAVEHCRYFMNSGIEVYLVDLPNGADPNSLGRKRIRELIDHSEMMVEDNLFELQIKSLL